MTVSKPTPEELEAILVEHARWLRGDGGERADLTYANLAGANLACANLAGAWLSGANLAYAKLAYAKLDGSNLAYADLTAAWLAFSDLTGADLDGADLTDADLTDTNLTGARLSGATGLLDAATWLLKNFKAAADGLLVYKAIGKTEYLAPSHWTIEPGAELTEVPNPLRTLDCACGVNFATFEWCEKYFPRSAIWRCRIAWIDLAGVVVPYHTDGKARCAKLTLLECVKEAK